MLPKEAAIQNEPFILIRSGVKCSPDYMYLPENNSYRDSGIVAAYPIMLQQLSSVVAKGRRRNEGERNRVTQHCTSALVTFGIFCCNCFSDFFLNGGSVYEVPIPAWKISAIMRSVKRSIHTQPVRV